MVQSTRSISAVRVSHLVTGFDRSPAYAGLAEALTELIGDGRIGLDVRLPSERDLTEALGVGLEHNGADLGRDPFLLLPPATAPPEIVTGPRIGITKAVDRPWRFCAAGSPFVSRPRPANS